jgi:hypothetical protein
MGGMFTRFFKWIVPLLKKSAGPILKGVASTLGSEAVSTVSNIAKDTFDGKPVGESIKQNANIALDNLKTKDIFNNAN